MRVIAIVLIASLVAVSSLDARAQETVQWRKVAESIELGTKVKIQTLDGKRVSGTLLSVDEKTVQVKRNSRRPEPAVTVTFDNISNLQRDNGGGVNWAKSLGIGLVAEAGVILTIFVIALQLD